MYRGILQIENAASENDYIQAAVEVGDLLERSGFTKKLMTDSAKLAIYTLKEYHIFYRAFPALRQYMEGKLSGGLVLIWVNTLSSVPQL